MQIQKVLTNRYDLFEIWHPYWEWEEVSHNMWGSIADHKTWLGKAIEFTGNHELYGYWMMRVANEWPRSCEQNLTKTGNKRAWIGHAAVAMATQCPEDVVREAWGYLTQEQQDLANDQAQKAIDYWRYKNA